MMIYVDDMFNGRGRGKLAGMWCHMWSDSGDEELIIFGNKIGLKSGYLQTGNPRFHHFDLREGKREQALRAGAEYMPLREWIKTHPLQIMKGN